MKLNLLATLIVVPVLCSCTGPGEFFEPETYGIRNSKWEQMSAAERQERRQDYYIKEQLDMQREALKEQKRNNDLLKKQIKVEAKANSK